MSVLLGLLAAAAYGLSDFVGGVVSRRVSPWTIAVVGQVAGAVIVLGIALVDGGAPTARDLAWASVAGVGNGLGTAFLYRGLSRGAMGVVAPVSAIGAALLPVAAGLATGERPGLLVSLGVLLAFPGIWLVAREPSSVGPPRPRRVAPGLLDGVVAGLGFGVLFAALGQVPERAGLLPLALDLLVGTIVVVAVAGALRAAWVPRQARAGLGVVSGLLGALATGLFLLATRYGDLSVAAVLVSLYPAFTVLLAAVVLRERVRRAQAGGLVLCLLAVALVAAG